MKIKRVRLVIQPSFVRTTKFKWLTLGGSSTTFLPFFPFFFPAVKPEPHSSSTGAGSSTFGSILAGSDSTAFLPFPFFAFGTPHPPPQSSSAGGSSTTAGIGSGVSSTVSSNAKTPPFFFFLSFFETDENPKSKVSSFFSGTGSGSTGLASSSSRAPKENPAPPFFFGLPRFKLHGLSSASFFVSSAGVAVDEKSQVL